MLQIVLGSLFSMVITLLLLPILIRFANSNHFFVEPSFRRVHKGDISALGGLAIFFSTFVSVIFFSDFIDLTENRYLLFAGIIMFLIGIRDVIKEVNPWIKLAGQIMVASIVVYLAGYQINSFSFFNNVIHFESPWSGFLTIAFIVFVVNAFNFIDGIDLQATLIALVILAPFGWWFFINQQYDMGLLLISLGASLLAFAIFNFSPARIFMGDMGTLIIGLLLAITFIRFSQLNEKMDILYSIKNPYVFVLTSFIIPSTDAIRVGFTRIIKGRSPMRGDKNHIHHWLLKLGWRQNRIALFTSSLTLFFIVFNYWVQYIDLDSILIVAINIVLIILIYTFLSYRIKRKV